MEIRINVEKWHFYIIVGMLAVLMSFFFVKALSNNGYPWHNLQNITTDGGGATSIDANSNGRVDDSDGVTCVGCVTLGAETSGTYDSTADTIADDGLIALGTETSGSYDSTADTIADDGVISDAEVSDAITISSSGSVDGGAIKSGTVDSGRVEYGSNFITTTGTNGQVWKSDGSGAGYWGADNTGSPTVTLTGETDAYADCMGCSDTQNLGIHDFCFLVDVYVGIEDNNGGDDSRDDGMGCWIEWASGQWQLVAHNQHNGEDGFAYCMARCIDIS
jgi:hypothetical protein